MFGRVVLIGSDVYAAYDDDAREVYFERNLSADKTVPCKQPGGYEIPAGYRVVAGKRQWRTKSNASWIV